MVTFNLPRRFIWLDCDVPGLLGGEPELIPFQVLSATLDPPEAEAQTELTILLVCVFVALLLAGIV